MTIFTQGKRTPEEQAILRAVARSNGQAWVDEHADLILDQARAIGDLPEAQGLATLATQDAPDRLADRKLRGLTPEQEEAEEGAYRRDPRRGPPRI